MFWRLLVFLLQNRISTPVFDFVCFLPFPKNSIPLGQWCWTTSLSYTTFSRRKIWCTTLTTSHRLICNFTQGWQNIQNPSCIPNHESIICNFKIQMPSLNQVTIKCVWQDYNYYIMATLLPIKVKRRICQIFKLNNNFIVCFEKYSCVILGVETYRAWRTCHLLIITSSRAYTVGEEQLQIASAKNSLLI
jgi:hypothetical protein